MSHQLWTTCRRHGISPNQLFLLDCYRENIQAGNLINENADKLICQTKGFIDSKGKLTEKATLLLEEFETLLVKKKKAVAKDVLGENFMQRVEQYRELFPKHRLPSGELARQSVQELKDKFVWFFKTYPQYDWDLVLDAADYYISVKQSENWMYMKTSSYFIKKSDRHKETVSTLADYCQYLLDNPQVS